MEYPSKRDVRLKIIERWLWLALVRGGLILAITRRSLASIGLSAEHDHLIHLDFSGVTLLAFFIGPFARAQATFDINLSAFLQPLATDFGQFPEAVASVPFGEFFLLAGRLILPTFRRSDGEVGDGVSRCRVAHLGIFAEVANDYYFIDGCHVISHLRKAGNQAGCE